MTHAISFAEGWRARLQAYYDEFVEANDPAYDYSSNSDVQATPALASPLDSEDTADNDARITAGKILCLQPRRKEEYYDALCC